MTRSDILSAGMLRQPHPLFLPLSYGRFIVINEAKKKIKDNPAANIGDENGIAWVICTRPDNDPDLVAALAADDLVASFRPLWQDRVHVADMIEFTAWFDLEFATNDAAATTHKPDSRLGKSEDLAAQNPTT